jgi:hypothetical protein
MISTILGASLASLALASPLIPRAAYPPTSSAQAFVLIANVTDLTKDLTPSVNHFKLVGVHVGAGLNTAILNGTRGNVLFENGTDTSFGIAANYGNIYPYGLSISQQPSNIPDSSYVEYIGINAGLSENGVGITGPEIAWPQLFGPDSGTFIVCNETKPTYGRPQYPVRFAKSTVVNGVTQQQIPDLCAPITLLPQCATLDPLPSGALYNYDYANTVRCYQDVASIQWA